MPLWAYADSFGRGKNERRVPMMVTTWPVRSVLAELVARREETRGFNLTAAADHRRGKNASHLSASGQRLVPLPGCHHEAAHLPTVRMWASRHARGAGIAASLQNSFPEGKRELSRELWRELLSAGVLWSTVPSAHVPDRSAIGVQYGVLACYAGSQWGSIPPASISKSLSDK